MNIFCKQFRAFVASVAILIVSHSSYSQIDSVALAEELFSVGMEVYDFSHRKQAKDAFIQATEFNPDHARAHFMAGKAIMLTVHKEQALRYFLTAYSLDKNVDYDIFLYIGQAYHHSEKFEDAIEYYQLHKRKLMRALEFEKSKKINEVERKIFECRNAQIYISHPVDVEITNLSTNINTEFPEYAPTVTADESMLIFTSRRSDNTNGNIADDNEYYEDIYVSRNVNGQFEKAVNIGAPINTIYHNASVGISPDGSELFLYMDTNGGDIYESDLDEKGNWSVPKPIPGRINSEYLENSASVTADLRTLFFTSDRPGGYGGTDIYYSVIERGGRYGEPVNVGSEINTEMDEDGVFISANGEHLYFSSNGHAGMGDMDIYRATKNDSAQWANPLNMGYPINTVENDIYFILSGDEKHGYYSSVKTVTKGEQDIYKVNLENFVPLDLDKIALIEEVNSPIEPLPDSTLIHLEMSVIDEESLESIEASIVLIEDESKRVLKPTMVSAGVYGVEFFNHTYAKYVVRISKEKYDSHTYELFVIGSKEKRREIKETVALTKTKEVESGILNVYFGVDSDVPHGFIDIQYVEVLLNNNPDMRVEIAGHTDNMGPAEYNKDLSLRRAEAVKKYLMDVGIDMSRITTFGFGAEKPIATNDNRQGRRLNRRIEFKTIAK